MVFRLIVVCSIALASAGAAAQGLESVFPRARVVYEQERQANDYSLALGPLRQIEGVAQPEREERLDGNLRRRTLEIPEGYSVEEIHSRLRDVLERLQARPLYTCAGLDCGSSNAWANDQFDIKQLYGLDQNQYYGAWEVQEEQGHYYLATYVVQRGNRRIYVQIDRLDPAAQEPRQLVASPATLVEALKERGYFVVTGVSWGGGKGLTVEPEHLQALVGALQRDPWVKVRLVGHDYGAGGLDKQTERSLGYAQALRSRLIEEGIKKERLSAHGVGSLAPAGRQESARLEVVRQM